MRRPNVPLLLLLRLLLLAMVPVGAMAAPGTWVRDVEAASPAADAGLAVGDAVLAWIPAEADADARPIRDPWDVLVLIQGEAQVRAGRLQVRRDGPTRAFALPTAEWGLALAAREPSASDPREACAGADAASLTDPAADRATLWTHFDCACDRAQREGPLAVRETMATLLARLDAGDDPAIARAARLTWAEIAASASQAELAEAALAPFVAEPLADDTDVPALLARLTLGRAAFIRGRFQDALAHYRAVEAVVAAYYPDGALHARALARLALAHSNAVDATAATALLPRAIAAIEASAPGRVEAASVHGLAGTVWRRAGQPQRAAASYATALTIYERVAPRGMGIAEVLNNQGILLWDEGDLVAAWDLLQRALAVRRTQPWNREALAAALNRLANLALGRGDPVEAADLLAQARAELEAAGIGGPRLAANANLAGLVALERNQLDEAQRRFEESVALWSAVAPGTFELSSPVRNLGAVALRRGDYDGAARRFGEARDLRAATVPGSIYLAYTEGDLADVALARGDLDAAARHAEIARGILARLSPATNNHAIVLHTLGRVAAARGDPAEARRRWCEAAEVLDAQRDRISAEPGRRSEFLARHQRIYRDCIRAEAAVDPARALTAAERFRARGMLELIAQRPNLGETALDPALREERRALQAEYDEASARLAASATADAATLDTITRRIASLRDRRAELEARIARASPRFVGLRLPAPLSSATLAAALPADAVAVHYVLDDDDALALVLRAGADAPTAVRLPLGAATIAAEVDALRRAIVDPRMHDARDAALARLHAALLTPLEPSLGDAVRVIIVPDGVLHLVPFAALRDAEGRPLAARRATSFAPSLTVLAELRARPPSRAGRRVLAIGDPLGDAAPGALRRSAFAALDLPALPESRREAEAVHAVYGEPAPALIGAAATEAAVRVAATSARVLHVAAHGVFDPQAPLGSALLLAPGPGSAADDDDGAVRLWELFDDWRLDADLVVLSACDTALGRDSAAEGLLGLARAFQYAGARAVLGTLWPVQDRATADLMIAFHRARAAGLPADLALQRAQLDLLRGGFGADAVSAADAVRGATALVPRRSATAGPPSPWLWAGLVLWGDGLR